MSIPTTDGGRLAFARNLSTRVSEAPATYGVDLALSGELFGKVEDYDVALLAATTPATRGGATCHAKDEARDSMMRTLRQVIAIIQAHPGVTDQMRYDLGLTIRKEPTPGEAPNRAPEADVVGQSSRGMTLRLHDAATGKRGRPAGVSGATLFTYQGESASNNPADWVFYENTTKTQVHVEFPADLVPGTKVWVCAMWFNAHGSGPASEAVSLHLGGAIGLAA